MGTREGANEQEKDSAGREDGNNWLVGQSELEEVEMDDSLDLAAWAKNKGTERVPLSTLANLTCFRRLTYSPLVVQRRLLFAGQQRRPIRYNAATAAATAINAARTHFPPSSKL